MLIHDDFQSHDSQSTSMVWSPASYWIVHCAVDESIFKKYTGILLKHSKMLCIIPV